MGIVSREDLVRASRARARERESGLRGEYNFGKYDGKNSGADASSCQAGGPGKCPLASESHEI